jgi:chromosome partitioning protein
MKTIAIGLQKGGTGISLVVTLAAELAGYGQTLLIDADPQGNASAWVGPDSLSVER